MATPPNTKRQTPDTMQRFGMMRGPMMMGAMAPRVRDRRGTMRRLWRYLSRDRAGLAGVAALVGLTSALSLTFPYLMGRAIDAVADLHWLAWLVGVMIAVTVLSAAGTWAQSLWMLRITQRTVRDIRRDLFARLQGLPLGYFDRHQHGELMSRLTNDTDTISATLGDSVTQFISSVLLVVGAGSIMFAMNWRLALVALATFPLVVLATWLIGKYSRQGFRSRQQALGALNGLVEETILGQRVVTVCRQEGAIIDKFASANAELRRTAVKALIYVGLMGPVMQVFRNIGFALLVGVGGWLVIAGLARLGTMVALITYADFVNRPLFQLANLYGTIQSALAGAERVFAVLDEAPEAEDAADADPLDDVRGEVEFDHVDFRYVPEVPVLRDVSFHAAAGQTIALVGPTGAGKTTIINLLTRFYEISAGAIRIDGRDIRHVRKDSLRRALGIVLQETYLFAGTVRENIRYGRLDATDAEVEAAAEQANAASFIRHLPHGFDTVLTDAGGSLSQGQRQLLAIARAMLADPAILILDEATSSVDTRTEVHIQQAIHRLLSTRTSFIIAHRLNTIRQADCILVIQDGQIVERGTHAELLGMRGAYYGLYSGQVGMGEMTIEGQGGSENAVP